MSTVPVQPKSFTYYHAGPLFTVADLHLNTQLSRRIHEISKSRFVPLLPQDIEPRDAAPDTTPNIPHMIRDDDLRALLSADLALFTYDGSELDSGTVVEYMNAKFADIPTVILRTDFRGAGDQGTRPDGTKNDPWNLMSSFWPRSTRVVVDSMGRYKAALKTVGTGGGGGPNQPTASEKATLMLINETAEKIVEAMEEVMKMPSTMPKSVREDVYRWIGVAPGWVDSKGVDSDMQYGLSLLKTKIERGLFPA